MMDQRRNGAAGLGVSFGAAAAALALAAAAAPVASAVTITGVGRYQLTATDTSMEQLSGLTYVGNNQFWAADDNSAKIFKISLGMDLNTGALTGLTNVSSLTT